MVYRLACVAAAAALLCACSGGRRGAHRADAEGGNVAAGNAAASATAETRDWLTGAWALDSNCEGDFVVHYNADGALDDSGDKGTWKLDGTRLTETITAKFGGDGAAPVKIDPPEVRVYAVVRGDATHGVIAYQGRSVSILRC